MKFLVFILLALMTGCGGELKDKNQTLSDSLSLTPEKLELPQAGNSTVFNCDKVFATKGLKIVLTFLRNDSADDNTRLLQFKFSWEKDGESKEIFKDTIESITQ